MAKKFLNGWQAPKFVVQPSGINVTIELKLRYQAFTEFVDETYIEHELLNGNIAEKFLYAHYFWELNYSALAETEELLKIKAILNYLQMGYEVRLFPHKEVARWFKVTTVKDRLSLGRHYGGGISPGEKDFGITFRTTEPRTTPGSGINWAELDLAGTPVQDVLNQYYFLTDEEDNFILDEEGNRIEVRVSDEAMPQDFETVESVDF